MVQKHRIRKKLMSLGVLAGLVAGCDTDICHWLNPSQATENYAFVAYSPSRSVHNPLFSTGTPDGKETEMNFSGRRDYENLFLFFDRPLTENLKADLRTGNEPADVEINLIYSSTAGDVILSNPIQVRRFILQPGEKPESLNLEKALQKFGEVRNNSDVLDKEITEIEIRNYGPGILFVDFVVGDCLTSNH